MSSGMQSLAFERLKGRQNFTEWKTGAKAYLISKGHWTQMTKELESDAPAVARTANSKALAELILLVEPCLYSYIEDLDEAKKAWDALLETYEDKGAVRKVTLLKQWISLKSTDCDSLHDYVNKSVSLRAKVKTAGFEINDEIAGSILLCGLSDDFKPLIMIMETKEKLTLDYVKTILLQNVDSATNDEGAAMSARFKNKRNGKKKPVKCYGCGGPHYKNKCPNGKPSEKSECVLYSAFSASKMVNEWFIDSGATRHMTHINVEMENKRKPFIPEVKVANDHRLKISHVGEVKCKFDKKNSEKNVTLKNVQYIPDLCVNLLSVSQMVKIGNTVVFNNDGCIIYNEKREVIATGEHVNDMFKMNIMMNESACASTMKTEDDYALWHRRLGHINFNSLKSALNIKVPTGLKCTVCIKGKHARDPFKETGSRAAKPLEIIHSDVCGKMSEKSLGGANYFVTFIDDFTRKIFIYVMKSKDEVFSNFLEFKNRAENELNAKIKVFRSDNGSEYVNKKFKKLFADSGIKFETSTVYTPQQNGLAERNNRTIVEKARCMLLDS